MGKKAYDRLALVAFATALAANAVLGMQETPSDRALMKPASLVIGHPFAAVKFARRVRVLADGKQRFLFNERYPSSVARDSDGRVMMQVIPTDELQPECNRLDLRIPPPCPAWEVFVIDPIAMVVTHWVQGKTSFHGAVDFPLTPARLEETSEYTSSMPEITPNFSDEDGRVERVDLGTKNIEGLSLHGQRWTLLRESNQAGSIVRSKRIHEIWTSMEMHLIVRVIDGDPSGEESIWGLEKITLTPDAALFRPPDEHNLQHYQDPTRWDARDFKNLKEWFQK